MSQMQIYTANDQQAQMEGSFYSKTTVAKNATVQYTVATTGKYSVVRQQLVNSFTTKAIHDQ